MCCTLLKLEKSKRLNCLAGTKMLFSANALAALLPPIILTTPTNFSSRKIKETAAKNSRKEGGISVSTTAFRPNKPSNYAFVVV